MTNILNRTRPEIDVSAPGQDITIGLTGPDWEPTARTKFFAQRGSGQFAFGPTEIDALNTLFAFENSAR